MPRENSFSGSDGRSLTPDLDEEVGIGSPPGSPTYNSPPQPKVTVVTEPVAPKPAPSLKASVKSPSINVRSPTDPPRPTFATPSDRFRASVRKVIQLHRTSSMISGRQQAGAEPGVDPRRQSAYVTYGHIRQNCLIEVADYSSVRNSFGRMTNKSFVDMMENEAASAREPWVKVRWINIGGISWDVISALALKYDIHPLALEDVLHQRGHHRSKADYYQKHLFLRVLSHTVADEDDLTPPTQPADIHPLSRTSMTGMPRSSSPIPVSDLDKYDKDRDGVIDLDVDGKVEDEEKTVFGSAPGSRFSTRRGIMKKRPFFGSGQGDEEGGSFMDRFTNALQSRKENQTNIISIEELKKGERVNVKVAPMFIFLFRDGTVITIHPTPNLEFTAPIAARLRQRDTGLRTSADPSLLVQSVLDLIVDQAVEVVDEYHGKILKLEHDILLKPKMTTVRHLHILSGDLILRKRTLEPIKTLVYGLRRYDVDRCAALVDMSKAPPGTKIEGFMSHKSKIYLADVHDHMEYILTSLDMFAGISENLINYTFNITSYEMNDFMRYLTLATIIFLPLTLLTGYFGMNFDNMWTVHHDHSDIIFWIIAIPLMLIIVPLFTYRDIIKMVHYLQKRMRTKEAVKTYKQA